MSKTISIVIPAKNSALTINECLDSLAGQCYDKNNFEITVVDDDSSDNTKQLVEEFIIKNPDLKTRYSQVNFSSAAKARNFGAAGAKGEFLLFLDSDVVCPPDLLERFDDRITSHNGVDVFQGIYSRQIDCRNFLSTYKNLYRHYSLVNLGNYIATIYSSVFTIKKDVFLSVGGFDAHYSGASIEDRALAVKLVSRRGYKILLCPEINVKHNKCFTFSSFTKNQFQRSFELVIFFLKGKQSKGLLKSGKFGTHSMGDIVRIPVVCLMVLSLLLAACSKLFFTVFTILFIFYLLLRRDFLAFIQANRGFYYTFLSVIIDIYDVFICSLGITKGFLKHLAHG